MNHPRAGDGTSSTLLNRLGANEGDAWERMVHLYGRLVLYWASRRGVTGADAEDVAQEVFQAVAAGLGGFRRDRPGDTFRGWLFMITRNVLLRHAQRAANSPRAEGGTAAQLALHNLPDAQDEPDPPAELHALYRRGLELVRGEFETRTWMAFWEHTVVGRTVAEVADQMGVTPAAVRQSKSRVLRRLREELGDLVE